MNDRPTASELIDAVRLFLEMELLPTLTDARLRFQTLIAANVLAIANREHAVEQEQLIAEWQLLGGTGDPPSSLPELRLAVRNLNERLCTQIRVGRFDSAEGQVGLLAMLQQLTTWKLQVANPRHLPEAGQLKPRA